MYSGPKDRIRPAVTGAPVTALRRARLVLFQGAEHHPERARRAAVVVEPGGLAGQPADQPDLVLAIDVDPFVPAPFGAEPDPGHPFARGGGELADFLSELARAERGGNDRGHGASLLALR